MTFPAMTWAIAQQLKPGTAKSLLVLLGWHANHEGLAWPSQATLIRETCFDRKTVISGLQRLEELCLIMDTGDRKGKGVKVYAMGMSAEEREEAALGTELHAFKTKLRKRASKPAHEARV